MLYKGYTVDLTRSAAINRHGGGVLEERGGSTEGPMGTWGPLGAEQRGRRRQRWAKKPAE